jgi:hypothetical protein
MSTRKAMSILFTHRHKEQIRTFNQSRHLAVMSLSENQPDLPRATPEACIALTRFTKGATTMNPGFVMPIFGQKSQEPAPEAPSSNRGSQVAQVSCQASESGEMLQLFIEVDLGYGRRINVV